MAKDCVKFFIHRMDAVLLQEAENFSGLEDDVMQVMGVMREIESFSAERGSGEVNDAVYRWVREVRDIINEMDDCVDGFIIQMGGQTGSDGMVLIDSFRLELQKIGSHLAEAVDRMRELHNSTATEGEKGDDEENSCSTDDGEASIELRYKNLPHHLQTCFAYCCIFPENYRIARGRLIRLLVADGLMQEKPGHVIEDIAEDNINELINMGMLLVDHTGNGTKLVVSSDYRQVCLHKIKKEQFSAPSPNLDSSIPHTVRCVSVNSDLKQVEPILNCSRTRSLFLFGKRDSSEENWHWLNLYGSKFLRVLDLEGSEIKCLPDEVGDLMHLRYLGLKQTQITELPEKLGNLRALQTLDIRWCGNLTAVSNGVLNLLRLRHLKMFKNIGGGGMNIPKGIGRIRSLLTLTGVDAGGCIARELGSLVQLRRLGVMDVNEDDANELFASIMKMQGLLCLSLHSKHAFQRGTPVLLEDSIPPPPLNKLALLENFIPPPLLRKLRLEGALERMPNWLGSMERLTNLRLGYSHLSENPASVLQLLPNLKILTLWHAYEAKQIGKEFCRAGGFPKLEDLTIASNALEEWTELEEGALPSLKLLHLHSCSRLRALPEGLQFVTTLKQLNLLPLLDDHEERLRPDGGEENYKIKHIPLIRFITVSTVKQLFESRGKVKNEEEDSQPAHPVT